MNAACTAATPTAGVATSASTTPPLANAAQFRLGRTTRRSSSSGSSPGSNGGGGGAAVAASVSSRKRRRHSTLEGGLASGSEEEGDRVPPTFRLRLGSYVSDLRLARTRSHSPSSPLHQGSAPLSPSGAVRQRHQLCIQTTVVVQGSPPPVQPAPASVSPTTLHDVEMDLDVQSTFQAMQVDSPTASPSIASASAAPFFASSPSPAAPREHLSPLPSNLLSPPLTDTPYPRSTSSFPAVSLVTHASTVSPAHFPSAALLARRNSRQLSTQHMPASPSPLARLLSFPATASANTQHQHQHQHQQQIPSFPQPFQPYQQPRQNRSRSTSTPPSPLVSSVPDEQHYEAGIHASPIR